MRVESPGLLNLGDREWIKEKQTLTIDQGENVRRFHFFGIFCAAVLLLLWATTLALPPAPASAQLPPLIEPYLTAGKLAEGEAAITAYLNRQPTDDKARFSLGMVQVIRGMERLMQSLYHHGARDSAVRNFLPILRLPVPENPTPETLTYDVARQILQTFLDDLNQAQATLAEVKDPAVKLSLRIGLIRMDVNGDGQADDNELFWKAFSRMTLIPVTAQQAQRFFIAFDTGDAVWLRGYCNLLAATIETLLGYHWQDLLETTGHLAFAKVATPHTFLNEERSNRPNFYNPFSFADIIAFIHLLNFDVAEPERLTRALQHLQTTLGLSRQSWQLIRAETDNDREWLPNPKQKGVIPNAVVTDEMIDRWLDFLDESEALLAGKKLAPFWRGDRRQGINLNRVFTQPRRLDVVLWFQGSGATPYLERGNFTNEQVWGRLLQAFGGNFLPFAFWFN